MAKKVIDFGEDDKFLLINYLNLYLYSQQKLFYYGFR